MKENMKIVFMGTPEFAKGSLEMLVENEFPVVACFTNPDKPAGRGMQVKMSPVKEYAQTKGIPVYQPQKVKGNDEIVALLKELSPDFLVVVAYGKILPKEILDIPKYGAINVHASLLPNYRGAAPIQWAMIQGEEKTGVTTMFMDVGMDTGDMLLKSETIITLEDTLETLYQRLMKIGAELLKDTLHGIVEGSITRIPQGSDFTLAPMISREMTQLAFHQTATQLFHFVRGLSPFPATYMILEDGRKFKVSQVKVVDTLEDVVSMEIGSVVVAKKDQLVIQCQEGYLSILEIQPENSKKMPIQSFMAGNKIKVGDRFVC